MAEPIDVGVLGYGYAGRRFHAYLLRFEPRVRPALAEGPLGRPGLSDVGSWCYGTPRGWRAQPDEAGTLLHDWGAHFVDQALQLVPATVTSVYAQTQHVRTDLPVESYIGAE